MRQTTIWITLIALLFPFASSQIYPGSYEVSGNVISESGSTESGHCSDVTDSGRVCNSPRSSVLFDDNHTLTELDGDMWARQLLTFNTSTSSATITFNFTNASDRNGPTMYTGVSIMEVVMYNCPTRGIGTLTNIIVSGGGSTIKNIDVTGSSVSCDYLVRVCDNSLDTTTPIITLNFNTNYQRIYVAEITFFSSRSRQCSAVGPILTSVVATTIPGNTVLIKNESTSTEITSSTEMTSELAPSAGISTSVPQASNSSTTAIIVAVVIVILIILIVVVIIILVIVFCWKKGMKYSPLDAFRMQPYNIPNKNNNTPELDQEHGKVDDDDKVATLSNKAAENENATPRLEDSELEKKKATSTTVTPKNMDEPVSNDSKFTKPGNSDVSSGDNVDKAASDDKVATLSNKATENQTVTLRHEDLEPREKEAMATIVALEYEDIDKIASKDSGNDIVSSGGDKKTETDKDKGTAFSNNITENQTVTLKHEDLELRKKKAAATTVGPEYEDIDDLTPNTKFTKPGNGIVSSGGDKKTDKDKGAVFSNKITGTQSVTQGHEESELKKKEAISTIVTSEYEDMDVLVFNNSELELGKKEGTFTKVTSEYEDMDVLVSNNSEFGKSGQKNVSSGGNDMTATDKDSHTYSHLDRSTGIEQSIQEPLEDSEHPYETLDHDTESSIVTVSTTDQMRSRSATAPGMYAAVNKPPPKPVRRSTQGKDSEKRKETPTIPERSKNLANKERPGSTSETPSDKPPPKPLRRNTHGKPSNAPTHSPPPEIPEKSHELEIYLETKVTTLESGSGTIMNTDNIYSEPDIPQPSSAAPENTPVESIYESVYSESLQPSLFKQKPDESRVAVATDDLCPYSSIYTVPTVPAPMEKPLEVNKKNIKEVKELGSGQFGKVILAKTVGLSLEDLKIGTSTNKKASVLVAVKKLKSSASQSARKKFEKEYRFMFRLKHPNVVRMLGLCTEDTPFIMMEYMEKGDLNEFLQHQYSSIIDSSAMPGDGEITLKTLVHICTQIASGMNYLATNNFVHRDVATRNCLMGEDFLVKIADFGMSRSLYDSHYYIVEGQALMPVRWMATECFYGKFSAKTDVWAFGCTMWEVFELCKHEPYYEMNDQEVVADAVEAGRSLLSCPEQCPECVYEIMKLCWTHEANERATFEELFTKLSSLDI